MTTKEYAYTILSETSKLLFKASIDLLCNQKNDVDSINLAKLLIELHEIMESFININCA